MVDIDKDNSQYYFQRSEVMFEQGKYKEATNQITKAIDVQKKDGWFEKRFNSYHEWFCYFSDRSDYYWNKRDLYWDKGDHVLANAYGDFGKKTWQFGQTLNSINLAQLRYKYRQYARAMKLIEGILKSGGGNESVYKLKGYIHEIQGENQKAISAFEKCIAAGNNEYEINLKLARLYQGIKNYK